MWYWVSWRLMCMKKVISFICLVMFLLSLSVTVFAGDVPEGLLWDDSAQVFFAEVLDYNNDKVTVSPRVKIKGDVYIGTKQQYNKPNPIGDFKVKPGNVYLFTYFDENNETNIFEVTSYDTATLKIKNTDFDIWKRFEEYLNEGEYEKAEQERIDKLNAVLTKEGEQISLSALLTVENTDCDKIEFALFGTQQKYQIEKEKFFELADEIYLTDVTNTLASNENSFVINAYDGNNIYTVIMWDKCKVEGPRTSMHSAPQGDYIIKAADYAKLVKLFPEEAQIKLPPLNNPTANILYWLIDNPTSALAISTLLITILAGTIGFVIGYKMKKIKSRRQTQ